MSQNLEPPDGPPSHDPGLELFGKGDCSRGGSLGAVFADFMVRTGDRVSSDHPLFGASDFVFDERLPEPCVVPTGIYTTEKDHGEMFLIELRQGARTGLAFDTDMVLDGGHPAELAFTHILVEDQKLTDAPQLDAWPPGAPQALRHHAWLLGGYIFWPQHDTRGRIMDVPEAAYPITFKAAWSFLKDVAIFNALLGVAAIAMAARVPRDGTTDRTVLSSGIWIEQPMRLDLERNLLFVPSYDDAKPWVARFEDLWLLNRDRYPEFEPVHEITEAGHESGAGPPGRAARSRTERPKYVGNLTQKVRQACKELKRRKIEIGTATVYDELKASELDPNRETVRRYVSDYMKTFEPS